MPSSWPKPCVTLPLPAAKLFSPEECQSVSTPPPHRHSPASYADRYQQTRWVLLTNSAPFIPNASLRFFWRSASSLGKGERGLSPATQRPRSLPILPRSFTLFPKRNASPLFSIVCPLLAQNKRGVPKLFFTRTPSARGQFRTRFVLSAGSKETGDRRLMTDDFSISSIPGTFRPTPAYLSTTARSSTDSRAHV